MRQRWVWVGALVAGLFAINAVTRLIARIWFHDNETAYDRLTLIMFALIGVTLAAVTFYRAQRTPPGGWLPDVVVVALGGLLLSVLVGPFVSGGEPFAAGAGNFFAQLWLYGGFAAVGVLLGYWLATALGRDYRSRSLKAMVARRATRPRRVVRR